MAVVVPNKADASVHENQAKLDSLHVRTLGKQAGPYGVVRGIGTECAVAWNNALVFDVGAGLTMHESGIANTVSSGQVTLDAAHSTDPRFDYIVVNAAGTKTFRKGTATPAASGPPPLPALTADDVVLAMVYVPAAASALSANHVHDQRIACMAVPDKMTVAQIGALASGDRPTGRMIYDTDSNLLHMNVGTGATPMWSSFGRQMNIATAIDYATTLTSPLNIFNYWGSTGVGLHATPLDIQHNRIMYWTMAGFSSTVLQVVVGREGDRLGFNFEWAGRRFNPTVWYPTGGGYFAHTDTDGMDTPMAFHVHGRIGHHTYTADSQTQGNGHTGWYVISDQYADTTRTVIGVVPSGGIPANRTGTALGTHSATTLADTTESWTVNAWAGKILTITSGTAAGQSRVILSNTATVITISGANLSPVPVNGDGYDILDPITNVARYTRERWRISSMSSMPGYGGVLLVAKPTYVPTRDAPEGGDGGHEYVYIIPDIPTSNIPWGTIGSKTSSPPEMDVLRGFWGTYTFKHTVGDKLWIVYREPDNQAINILYGPDSLGWFHRYETEPSDPYTATRELNAGPLVYIANSVAFGQPTGWIQSGELLYGDTPAQKNSARDRAAGLEGGSSGGGGYNVLQTWGRAETGGSGGAVRPATAFRITGHADVSDHPTTFDGSLFYRQTEDRFRVRQAGAWRTIVTGSDLEGYDLAIDNITGGTFESNVAIIRWFNGDSRTITTGSYFIHQQTLGTHTLSATNIQFWHNTYNATTLVDDTVLTHTGWSYAPVINTTPSGGTISPNVIAFWGSAYESSATYKVDTRTGLVYPNILQHFDHPSFARDNNGTFFVSEYASFIQGGSNPALLTIGAGTSVTILDAFWASGLTVTGPLRARRGFRYDDATVGTISITSITRSGTTATATCSGHQALQNTDFVVIAGATGGDAALYNGTFKISGVTNTGGNTTFNYTMTGTPGGSATGTITSTWFMGQGAIDIPILDNASLYNWGFRNAAATLFKAGHSAAPIDGTGASAGVTQYNVFNAWGYMASTFFKFNSNSGTPGSSPTYLNSWVMDIGLPMPSVHADGIAQMDGQIAILENVESVASNNFDGVIWEDDDFNSGTNMLLNAHRRPMGPGDAMVAMFRSDPMGKTNKWRELLMVGRRYAMTPMYNYYPKPVCIWSATDAPTILPANTTAAFVLVNLPVSMSVYEVLFNCTNIGTSGCTAKMAWYTEDGLFLWEQTTSGITSTGTKSVIPNHDARKTVLPAGNYWVGMCLATDAGTNPTFSCYTLGPLLSTSSPRIVCGTLTISASTFPASFNPQNDITSQTTGAWMIQVNGRAS